MRLLKEHFHLMEDQVPSAKSLVQKRRALYVDSTGAGKTAVVLYSFAYLLSKGSVDALLVITPPNAHEKEVWRPQIQELTYMTCISFDEVKKKKAAGVSLERILRDYRIVYFKNTHFKNDYELATAVVKYYKQPLAVVDEVHFARTGNNTTAACLEVAIRNIPHWGITATDLSRSCMDIYHIVDFLWPKKLGSQWKFKNEFCNLKEVVIGRNPDHTLKKIKEVVGFKDGGALRDALSDMLVVGTRPVSAHIHEVRYDVSPETAELYYKISRGLTADVGTTDEDWIQQVLGGASVSKNVRSMKDIERHASRYIYLQSVVDGTLNPDGTFGCNPCEKSRELIKLCTELAAKGLSALIYCDYYTSIDTVREQLEKARIRGPRGQEVQIMETSARKKQKAGFVSKEKVAAAPHFILVSRAASESENFPFINNVIYYNIPTTPVTYMQFLGRITRRNTMFPDDLHAWLLLADNIDLYKLKIIGMKLHLMQATTYDLSGSFPAEYMAPEGSAAEMLALAKKHLLWDGFKAAK